MKDKRDVFELYNASGVSIPQGGVCMPVGGYTDEGALKVGLPTADSMGGLAVAVDGFIPPGKTGSGTFDNRVLLAFDSETGRPEPGDSLGSQPSSFFPLKGNFGFFAYGDSASNLVSAVRGTEWEQRDYPSGGCRGAESVLGLRSGDCMRVVYGTSSRPLTSTDGELWTGTLLEICGVNYSVEFDRNTEGEPILRLFAPSTAEGISTPAATIKGKLGCAGCNYWLFAFDKVRLCPCEPWVAGGPCANVIRVRVEWVPCKRQIYDVVSPCCPGVKLPRVVCIRRKRFGVYYPFAVLEWNPATSSYQGPITCTDSVGPTEGTLDLRCGSDGGCMGCELGCCFWYLTQSGNCNGTGIPVGAFNPFTLGRKYVGGEDGTPCPPTGADFGFLMDYVCGIPDTPYVCEADGWDIKAWTPESCVAGFGIPGWGGPGWYRVRSVGSNSAGSVVELLEEDACDTTIEICRGPYGSEALAEASPPCVGSGGGGGGESTFGDSYSCPAEGFTEEGYYCSRPYGTTENTQLNYTTEDSCLEIVSGPHGLPPESAPCYGQGAGGGGPTIGSETYTTDGGVVLGRVAPRRFYASIGGWTLVAENGTGTAWLLITVAFGPVCRWRVDSWDGTGTATFLPLDGGVCASTIIMTAG